MSLAKESYQANSSLTAFNVCSIWFFGFFWQINYIQNMSVVNLVKKLFLLTSPMTVYNNFLLLLSPPLPSFRHPIIPLDRSFSFESLIGDSEGPFCLIST